jgi:rare lipoprotein A (peptidoglycan hydrolase)
MQAGRNRRGRKDDSRRAHALGGQGRHLRWVGLAAALLVLALGPNVARAQTGGAGVFAYEGTDPVAQDIAFSPMRSAGATWYGPGLYGNQTACGHTLQPATIGVAHRSLPCGTAVKFAYRGRLLVTRVIDRGPYTRGNAFDLTNGARLALGFPGVDKLRYAVALQATRP